MLKKRFPSFPPLERSQIDRPPLSNIPTIFIDQHRKRDHSRSDEPHQTIPPPQAKLIEHCGSRKRQKCAKDTSDGRHTRDSGSCVHGKRVNEVGLDRGQDPHHTETKRKERNNWDGPMDMVVGGPAVPEQTDWDQRAKENNKR